MNEIYKSRLGLIPALAERAAAGHIGRTALMKYLYFLQTLRDVPLGYQFSLYSYGPFDSEVLADLSSAEALNIVEVNTVEFSGGYGYRIKPGIRAESAKRAIAQFLSQHGNDIDWIFSVFGSLNSAELELASTIVYVDHELAECSRSLSANEVVTRVNEIKPHFNREQIQKSVATLLKEKILGSTLAN